MYFDDSHDTVEASEQLEAKWHDIRKRLEHRGASTAIVGVVEQAVLNHRPAVGRRGRAVIATGDLVLINEHLITPPAQTLVRVSDYPYVLPIIDHEVLQPTYVFASVDHTGADVFLYRGGTFSSTSIEGAGYPVHKPVTAGWNGYGDLQHKTDEAVRMNCRAIADHLTQIVDEANPEVVFVSGEVCSRADLLTELPERVSRRVLPLHGGARKGSLDEEEIYELAATEFSRRRRIETLDVADRFVAEIRRNSGLATQGLSNVCAALRDGNVDTLLIGEMDYTTVVVGEALTTVAPGPDALSELGEPVTRLARADEALPFTALCVGASLARVNSGVELDDGVGAMLRYAATEHVAVDEPARRRGAGPLSVG